MALQGLMEVNHNQVLNQLDALIAKHTHPSFAPHRRQLEEEGLPADFYDQLYRLTESYRNQLLGRDQAEATFESEAKDARDWAEEGRRWLRYVHSRVGVANAERAVNADNAARALWYGLLDLGTPSSVADGIDKVLTGFNDPVTAVVKVYTGCLDEGRNIWKKIQEEQAGYHGAAMARQIGTGQVHNYNDQITQRLELLVAIRQAVEIRFGIELPGFEFEILRAAAARSKKEDEDPPAGEGDSGLT